MRGSLGKVRGQALLATIAYPAQTESCDTGAAGDGAVRVRAPGTTLSCSPGIERAAQVSMLVNALAPERCGTACIDVACQTLHSIPSRAGISRSTGTVQRHVLDGYRQAHPCALRVRTTQLAVLLGELSWKSLSTTPKCVCSLPQRDPSFSSRHQFASLRRYLPTPLPWPVVQAAPRCRAAAACPHPCGNPPSRSTLL